MAQVEIGEAGITKLPERSATITSGTTLSLESREMACTRFTMGEFVTEGERLAAHAIQEYLATRPEQWIQVVNALVLLGNSPREIDQIVLGPGGVFVIDVKSFGGTVRSEAGYWILDDGSRRKDPIGAIHHLAGCLKGRLASASASLSRVWVPGILLFTSPQVDLSRVDGSETFCYLRLSST